MAKFKPYRRDQLHLLPPSLDDYVPDGHLARVVYEIVEGLDTAPIEDKYSELGQHTYHPRILLKLLFYGYATGVRSGRKIAARCESDTAYMYLAEGYRPDFRTINDFRKDNLPAIAEYFREMVQVCRELGMGQVGEICLDGSKLRANAAPRRSKDQAGYEAWLQAVDAEIRRLLNEAEAIDRAEDERYGEARGDELPAELRTKGTLRGKIQEALSALQGEAPDRVNLTDPDSRFMQERKGVLVPAYNCQLAVAEGQLIVGADVVTETNDRKQLLPMIVQTEKVTGDPIHTVIADSGYASYDNYEALATRGTTGYIPDQYFAQREQGTYRRPERRYHKENFRYDPGRDQYVCPEGKPLRLYKERDTDRGVVKRRQLIYKGTECAGCTVRAHCTRAPARTLVREKREGFLDRMRQRLHSSEGRATFTKRLYTVEPIFGHFKYNLGYKTFLLRTLDKVRGEFKLMCIGYNLRKLWSYRQAQALAFVV
jgi:transposase